MSSEPSATHHVAWFADNYEKLVGNIELFIRGKREAVELAVTCLLADGHLLIEDVPGVAKTSLAKCLAQSISAAWRRIQCTPDLLPSDITGVQIYNQGSRQFEFHPGPCFTNIVLIDEINRASPKTQSALLEVMEERQITVDAVPYSVEVPFCVLATQNPIEMEGTYQLPEAQIDRFLMRISIGYPAPEDEVEVMASRARGEAPEQLQAVLTKETVLEMIEVARSVYVAPALRHYIVAIANRTRQRREIRLGASLRASLAIEAAVRVRAASHRRPFATPDDVKALIRPVLAHRLLLSAEAATEGIEAEAILAQVMDEVPVPAARAEAAAR